MSVTVLSPEGSYDIEGVSAEDVFNSLTGSQNRASASQPNTAGGSVFKTDAASIPNKIQIDEIKKNKNWLRASRIMYESSMGRSWKGSDEALANWGLDKMARFNYNLMLGTVPDAVSIKNASDTEKQAFLFMVDSFDKIDYSAEGFWRGLREVLTDPSTYFGLLSLGWGTAASQASKMAGKTALKAAIRAGMYGAVEGGIYGAAQETARETALVNADATKTGVDWSKVGFGTVVGAGAGGVIGGGIGAVTQGLANRRAARAVTQDATPPVAPDAAPAASPDAPATPVAPVAQEPTQLGLPLEQPPLTTQPRLPGVADVEQTRPINTVQDWQQKFSNNVVPPNPRDPILDSKTGLPTVDEAGVPLTQPSAPRLGDRAQTDLFVEGSPQIELFDNLPMVTKKQVEYQAELRARRAAAVDEVFEEAVPNRPDLGQPPVQRPPRPKGAENPIDGSKVTLDDVKQLIRDLGDEIGDRASIRLKELADLSSPLARAFANMTGKDADELARQIAKLRNTDPEFQGIQSAAIEAENLLVAYKKAQLDKINELQKTNAGAPIIEAEVKKSMLADDVLSRIQPITNQLSSSAGRDVVQNRLRTLKGANRDLNVSEIAKEMGLNPSVADDYLKAETEFFKQLELKTAQYTNDFDISKLKLELAELGDMNDPANMDRAIDIFDSIAELRAQKDALAILEGSKKPDRISYVFMQNAANAAGGLVLGPSSTIINIVSNSYRMIISPALRFLGDGTLSYAAFKQMTQTYMGYLRGIRAALQSGKLSFEMGQSFFTGTESQWLERNLRGTDLMKRNVSYQGFEHHFINFFYKFLAASDEAIQMAVYRGWKEGELAAEAVVRAQKAGRPVKAEIKAALLDFDKKALNTTIDQTVVGQARMAALRRGLRGDAAKEWAREFVMKNKDRFRRAVDEHGIHFANDMVFRLEFSGDNPLSAAAKGWERNLREQPALKLVTNLFWRTPIRVFEAGIRATPGLNVLSNIVTGGKFHKDLMGKNGPVREAIARGEMLLSYGFGMGISVAYANGLITGAGGTGDYKLERTGQDRPDWRPYSIRVWDKWISYRNLDPFATPLKILTNFFERNQFIVATQRYVPDRPQGDPLTVSRTLYSGLFATLNAVRDANLVQGAGDLAKLSEGLMSEEKSKLVPVYKWLASKAQMYVPNTARRAIRYFGEGQDVANEPRTLAQAFSNILDPNSDLITHQYDALGNRRSYITQGTLGYFGIDIRSEAYKGYSKRDAWTLKQVDAMSFNTGKVFVPSPKFPKSWGLEDKDMREMLTADKSTTVYNKAMEFFNKYWPQQAYSIMKNYEKLPPKPRKVSGQNVKYKDQIYREHMNRVWNEAVKYAMQNDARIVEGIKQTRQNQIDSLLFGSQSGRN